MKVPPLPAPGWLAALLNVVGAAAVHAGTGYLAHRLPSSRLQSDGVLRIRRWERDGDTYRRAWRIHKWKDRLPEAGAFFAGGISKRHLPGRGPDQLALFAVETRRAERAHWWAMSIGPLSALWNSPAGIVAMNVYAVGVNLPFIAIQRYNRARIQRLARIRAARAERSR